MSMRLAVRSILALIALASSTPSIAVGLFRAYLASDGSDANPCTLAQPCRLLPAALAAVTDGGEIWMLDSANFNTATVNITKSVSILAIPGAVGSIVATGGPAINIATASVNVALRNVVVVPLVGGSGTNGINLSGLGASLHIEESVVANLPGIGVNATGTGRVRISNSIFRRNLYYAVQIANGILASIANVKMIENGWGGVYASTTLAGTQTIATMSDSVVSGVKSGDLGVDAAAGGTASSFAGIYVTRSTLENLAWGIISETTAGGGTAIVTISANMVTNNVYPWYTIDAGQLRSLGNNHITNNGAPFGVATPTAVDPL